jgi:tetratricopeptide (TPR) repeat protein
LNPSDGTLAMRRELLLRSVVLLWSGLSLGCASARIRKANALALAAADTRVLEGCYDCLQEARGTYARVAGDKHTKQPAPVIARLFETDVLLALREKELALDSRPSIDRARANAPRVPASVDAKRVLAIVDAVFPDDNGLPAKTMRALRRTNAPFTDKVDGELAWLAQAPLTPEVRRYIALALDCSYSDRRNKSGDSTNTFANRRQVPINVPPLVSYGAASCDPADTLALKRVLAAVPSFDEAGYALARSTVFGAGETGGGDVLALLARAHARFPRAAGTTFLAGWLNYTMGECDEAIALYDQTLAVEPAHDRALLQTVMCLTTMRRDSAAIAGATRFIALDTPNIHEGYYWRAANRLRRKELLLARSDIEQAKSRARGTDVLTLAGVIEHEQDSLTIAEADLRSARRLPKGDENCTAAFYLGSVLTKREVWDGAAAVFDSAMVCYDQRASDIMMKIDIVRASTKGSAAFRAKRIAALEEDLADRRRRYYTSAFNAASMNARAGKIARAEELIAIAVNAPELADQVAKLREGIARAR